MQHSRQENESNEETTAARTISVEIIGRRIRELREARGKSIEELAQAAGLEAAFIEAVETGNEEPTLDALTKFAKGLELPLSQLFGPLTPAATVIAVQFEKAPAEVQGAMITLLKHPWVKA